MPRWIYLASSLPTLTILVVGIITVYYTCKKRFANIYSLARIRGKTTEITGYNAVPVYTSTQHEEDSVVLTGVKQKQDWEVDAMSTVSVLRLAPPVTTQV